MTISPKHTISSFTSGSGATADAASEVAAQSARRSRRTCVAAVLTGAALLATGFVGTSAALASSTAGSRPAAANSPASTTTPTSTTVPAHWESNIVDRMARTVALGLGEPDMGGTWTTSNDSLFSVDANGGRIAVGTGATARAFISGATSADQTVRTSFYLPTVPTVGNGTYVALELRRQANASAYRARVQMTTDNRVVLAITRVGGGTETMLGAPVVVSGVGGSGQQIDLSATITGTSPVQVSATATPAGSSPTTISQTDTSSAQIAVAGRFGIATIDTVNTPAVVVVVRGVSGERWVPETQVPTSPSPTPTSPAPTSPAPTSPTSPTPPVTRGAAAAGTTSYPIPDSNVVYVSPTGSDTNPGTIDAPYLSLGRASAKAKPGVTTTIVLRGGSYHESVITQANKPLVIQNYPGEAVWFDGSVPVSGWTHQGSQWVHTGWTPQFDSTAGYDAAQAAAYQWLRPDHLMAAHPDEVFLDGVQLTQVASASGVVPGTFYSDYVNNSIVIGSNPTGHAMRASDLQKALTVLAPGTIVRGINFRRFATPVPQQAAVILDGDNQRLENSTISDIASAGLQVSGTHVTLDQDTFTNNGLQGLKVNLADYLTVSNSIITGNNSEYFNLDPVAAGIKLTRTDYATLVNNLIAGNHATGVWFDTSSYAMTISGNDVLDNEHHGIMLELSAQGTIAGNTASGNTDDGIHLSDTGNTRIWNNTLANNAGHNLMIDQDTRVMTANSSGRDTRRPFPDATLDWTVKNIEIRNNVMIGAPDFHVYTRNVGTQTPTQQGISFNHNLLSAITGSQAPAIGVNIRGYTTPFSASAWTSYSGDGAANVQSNGTTSDTMTTDLNNTASAVPLPSDIATLLGQPAGAQVWGRC